MTTTQAANTRGGPMTDLEHLLIACATWEDGRQGFDAEAASVLADWLEENGRQTEARCVRQITAADLEKGWKNQHFGNPATRLCGGRGRAGLWLEFSSRDTFYRLFLTEGDRKGAGFWAQIEGYADDDAWLELEADQARPILVAALAEHAPAIRLAAVRHVCGYAADRLLARVAEACRPCLPAG